jgi:hypothetical protein
MSTVVRHLIDDLDSTNYKYSDSRIETAILVSAQLTVMNVDFKNDYSINVESCHLFPDPTDLETQDNAFISLVALRAACIIIGGEIRKESGNAISIKDGPSAIDLRGVSQTLTALYKDLSGKYDHTLLEYRAGNSLAGHMITGPYSPGSDYISNTRLSHRDGGFFIY